MNIYDRYLKREETTTGDIALPADKAATKTKAAKKNKKPKGFKKLLFSKITESQN
jgi:hypothetical protein